MAKEKRSSRTQTKAHKLTTDRWIELADGIKGRNLTSEQARAEFPEIVRDHLLPIRESARLNDYSISPEQFETVKAYFGRTPTPRDIKNFLMSKGVYNNEAGWDTVVQLMQQSAPLKAKPIKDRFTFTDVQAFFDGKDLDLPTRAERNAAGLLPSGILKMLVDLYGVAVEYKFLDGESTDIAGDGLRLEINTMNDLFVTHDVPCKITSKKYYGYKIDDKVLHKKQPNVK